MESEGINSSKYKNKSQLTYVKENRDEGKLFREVKGQSAPHINKQVS